MITSVIAIYGWKVFLAKEKIMDRLQSSVGEGDIGGRQEIWLKVIPIIENNPLFGVGKTGYSQYALGVFNKFFSPHNVLLEILIYTGIIGLSIFSYFLFRLVKQSYSYYIATGFLLSLLLFSPVFGLILSGQILGKKIVFIIFAFAASRIFYLNNTNKHSI